MNLDISSRWRAFTAHLLASMLIGSLAIFVVFGIWYPAPLQTATGVTQIFLILLGVDIIIGPIFTLLVFKKEKPSLPFDLAVIVFLQLAAFSYGMFTVAEGRPAWLVFGGDRFDMVRINEIDNRKIESAPLAYRYPSWQGPQWAAVLTSDAGQEFAFDFLATRFDQTQRPEYYRPLKDAVFQLTIRAKTLEALKDFNPEPSIAAALKKYPEADAWVPMKGNALDMVVFINRGRREVLGIVDLRPW